MSIYKKKKVFLIGSSNGKSLEHCSPCTQEFEQVDFYNFSKSGLSVMKENPFSNVVSSIGYGQHYLYIIFVGWNHMQPEQYVQYPFKFLSELFRLKEFDPKNIWVLGALPRGNDYKVHEHQMSLVRSMLNEVKELGFQTLNTYDLLHCELKTIRNLFSFQSKLDKTYNHYSSDIRTQLHSMIANIIQKHFKLTNNFHHDPTPLISNLQYLHFRNSKKRKRHVQFETFQ